MSNVCKFRFAKNKLVSSENYVTVMIRLHLAHGKKKEKILYLQSNKQFLLFPERFHSIDTKMKGNPLSLEEMILMTIYSWPWSCQSCMLQQRHAFSLMDEIHLYLTTVKKMFRKICLQIIKEYLLWNLFFRKCEIVLVSINYSE